MKFIYGLILVNILMIVATAAFADFLPWVCALALTSVLNVVVFSERPGSEKAPRAVHQAFFKTRDRIKGCEPIEKGTAKLLLMLSPLAYVVAILISGQKISPVSFVAINALGLITLTNLVFLIWPEHKNLTGWFIKYYQNNIRGWLVMYWLDVTLADESGLCLKVVPRPFMFQFEHILCKNMINLTRPHIVIPIGGWLFFRKCWTQVYRMQPAEGFHFSGRWQVQEPGPEVCPYQHVDLTDWEKGKTERTHIEKALRVVGGAK